MGGVGGQVGGVGGQVGGCIIGVFDCRSELNLFLRGNSISREPLAQPASSLRQPTPASPHAATSQEVPPATDTIELATSGVLETGLMETGLMENDEVGGEKVEEGAEGMMEEGGTVGHMVFKREESVSDAVRKSPGFLFLTRADLYKFAKVGGRSLS